MAQVIAGHRGGRRSCFGHNRMLVAQVSTRSCTLLFSGKLRRATIGLKERHVTKEKRISLIARHNKNYNNNIMNR
jgi:hypothetical protein